MDEGFPSDPKAADQWPSTKSLPSGSLAELCPSELRGKERMAVGMRRVQSQVARTGIHTRSTLGSCRKGGKGGSASTALT